MLSFLKPNVVPADLGARVKNKTMKKLFLGAIALFISASITAQEEDQDLYYDACECIEEISFDLTEEARNEAIDECLTSAILSKEMKEKFLGDNLQQQLETLKTMDSLSNGGQDTIPQEIDIVLNPRAGYEELQELLMDRCVALENLLSSYNIEAEFSMSSDPEALALYESGNRALSIENYEEAIKMYKKALKKDKKFAFCWDNLGIAYRYSGDIDQAIASYEKSLKLDPKGRVALGNIAIAYELKGDYDEALLRYRNYAVAKPDDPEAYYGAGRMYHLKKDYENALHNMMKAYLIYKDTNNPYIQDAENNLAKYYVELKEQGREALFNEIGKEYNIEIED